MTTAHHTSALFHLAFNVRDLDIARQFYSNTLGCTEGRSTDTWVDFSLFNHQLSMHIGEPFATHNTGKVGEHWVPMPHFGLVLPLSNWHAMRERLETANIDFVIKPHCRFAGEAGEQWTMFLLDPFGNPIEFKGFADMAHVFAG